MPCGEGDPLGRRIRKTVAKGNGTAYVVTVDRTFIYDGWNLIAECELLTTFTVTRTSVQGHRYQPHSRRGGGVCGLLPIYDRAATLTDQTICDGNGHGLGLVHRRNGAMVAPQRFA